MAPEREKNLRWILLFLVAPIATVVIIGITLYMTLWNNNPSQVAALPPMPTTPRTVPYSSPALETGLPSLEISSPVPGMASTPNASPYSSPSTNPALSSPIVSATPSATGYVNTATPSPTPSPEPSITPSPTPPPTTPEPSPEPEPSPSISPSVSPTVPETPPSLMVITGSASNVTSNSATLNGNLPDTAGLPNVEVYFQWGVTASYQETTETRMITQPGTFIASIFGLSPGTTWHFRARVVAENEIAGLDVTFTTLPEIPPPPPPPSSMPTPSPSPTFSPAPSPSPTPSPTPKPSPTPSLKPSISPRVVVTFADHNLETVIRQLLQKPSGDIYKTDLEAITVLKASSKNIGSIMGLEHCTNLQELDLSYNYIGDIKALAGLTKMKSLNLAANRLNSNHIEDISALSKLAKLEVLSLSGNPVRDLTPLARLTSLRTLDLSNILLNNISTLAHLTKLESLNLLVAGITDVSHLRSLTGLQSLTLFGVTWGNPGTNARGSLSDISALSNLKNLRALYLTGTKVSNISALASLTSLESLSLNNNQISDISPLAKLTGLQLLDLGYNQIQDISPLSRLTSLWKLALSYNQISNISAAAGMTRLQEFNIVANKITDISALSRLTSLETLYLQYNEIRNISALAGLTNLNSIDLTHNQVDNVSPLVQNQDITMKEYVNLSYNMLDIATGSHDMDDIETLVKRGVRIIYQPQQTTYYTITIKTEGSGSTDPAPGNYRYAAGTEIKVQAAPASGWGFVNWSGPGISGNGWSTKNNPAGILMDGDQTVTASFVQNPPPPVLKASANGTVQNLTPKLEWNPSPDAASYSIQILVNYAIANPLFSQAGITGTTFIVPSGALSPGKAYQWRVNVKNKTGVTSDWSSFGHFKIPPIPPTVMTTDLSKVTESGVRVNCNLTDGGTAESIKISFQWGTTPGSYKNETQTQTVKSAGDYYFDLTGLSPGITYYYRAKAVGDGTVYGVEKTISPLVSPPQGKIAFYSNRAGNNEIYVINADGSNLTRLTNNSANDVSPAWSPDGSQIAFISDRDGNSEIYVMKADGSNPARLTNNKASDTSPAWSPDGSRLAFSSNRDGKYEIYIMQKDGSKPIKLTQNGGTSPAWSPDGKKIAFADLKDHPCTLYTVDTDGKNLKQLVLAGSYDRGLDWSPDGTRIVFGSGGMIGSISVIDVDGKNGDDMGPFMGASQPEWSPDGKLIVFSKGSLYIMAPDGSSIVQLTDSPANTSIADSGPRWAPNAGTQQQYKLTINITGNGTVIRDPYLPAYPAGTKVQLIAQPADGWKFDGWAGNFDSHIPVQSLLRVVTITIDRDKTMAVQFSPVTGRTVAFPDRNLEAAIRKAINKSSGDIYASDLEKLTSFVAQDINIANLSGIEYCINLQAVGLAYNQITDITPLAKLTGIQDLELYSNKIADIKPLAGLTNLKKLGLGNNQVEDISSLVKLTNLAWLDLNNNQLISISTLVQNQGIGSGDEVFCTHNKLNTVSGSPSMTDIQSLINRGVKVAFQPQDIQFFTLTVKIVGLGGVTEEPDQLYYVSGTTVKLTAQLQQGNAYLAAWSGDLTGRENPATVIMNSNKSVTATFQLYNPLHPAMEGFPWEGLPLDQRIQKTQAALKENDDQWEEAKRLGIPSTMYYSVAHSQIAAQLSQLLSQKNAPPTPSPSPEVTLIPTPSIVPEISLTPSPSPSPSPSFKPSLSPTPSPIAQPSPSPSPSPSH